MNWPVRLTDVRWLTLCEEVTLGDMSMALFGHFLRGYLLCCAVLSVGGMLGLGAGVHQRLPRCG